MVPSHKRILLLVYFSSPSPFGTKCVLILFSVSPPTGGCFYLSISVVPPNLEQSSLLILLSGSLPIRGLIHLSSSAAPHHLKQCALFLFSGSLPSGEFFYLSISAFQHHYGQSVLGFFSRGPFEQVDCLTCLVQQFHPIWNKVCSLSYSRMASDRRIVSLV